MFVWFEDWSTFLSQVRPGLPRGDHLLKVFASDVDPRSSTVYRRRDIAVFKVDSTAFREKEVFDYGGRGSYTGADIEQELQRRPLGELTIAATRALFRFAHSLEAVRVAMELTDASGAPLIDHPLDEVDLGGVKSDMDDPARPHLDIFTPASLGRVARLLRTDTLDRCPQVVSFSECLSLKRRRRSAEGADHSPARRK